MKPPPWSETEKTIARVMAAEGYDDRAIGKRLGRSATGVHIWLRRNAHIRELRPYSARDVARLMGWGCNKKVIRLVSTGALRATRKIRAGPNRRVSVLRDDLFDLFDFIHDERYWHTWKAETIVDLDLRRWADEVRGDVRYLTPGEVGEHFYVVSGTVNSWIAQGLLPARRWGNWWILESVLQDFVPPFLRERGGLVEV